MTRLFIATVAIACVLGPGAAGVAAGQQLDQDARRQRALLDRYCVACHNDRLRTGGLSLQSLDITDVQANAEILEKVARKLRDGQMPPEGRRRPDAATLDSFATTLESALDRTSLPEPGRVASHRLNRTEYVNVIRDLLALEINGADFLPSDLAGFGFDNNADVLAFTPALMARYMSAATKISRLALSSPDNRPTSQVYAVPVRARQDVRMGRYLPFATQGGLAVRHTFPLDGEYAFKIRLQRNSVSYNIEGIEEDEHAVELRVDHALIKRFTIGGKFKGLDPGTIIGVEEDDLEGQRIHTYRMTADDDLEVRIPMGAGTRTVAAAFTRTLPSAVADGPRIGIDKLQISGPYNGRVPDSTPSRERILVCYPSRADEEAPCARTILSTLARRAYRRPVTDSALQPLFRIYETGRSAGTFDTGIERAVEAMLSSPKFLIRLEEDPVDAVPGATYRLSDLELAARLSFFLWKSIPDDELLDLAARDLLSDATVLPAQVRRMLADRRSKRFMDDFVEQWLQVRNIYSHEPDGSLFRNYDATLRDAMARETQLFFESQMREDRPLQELLRADYTYLNERLARHYGIGGVYGSHLRRVTLSDDRRMGLLGQGSILMVTSYPDRTSVVLRGKWILENLLGSPPPPPPPNVPPLEENTPGAKPESLRKRMEQHRSNPVCASCHNRMDPLGFALEHYDAVGHWREADGGAPIDATITLAGENVDSPRAFREALLGYGQDAFIRTVVEKLLTYALGRGLDYPDAPTVRHLVRDLAENDYRWSSLVLGIVESVPFQMRRASRSGGTELRPTTAPAGR